MKILNIKQTYLKKKMKKKPKQKQNKKNKKKTKEKWGYALFYEAEKYRISSPESHQALVSHIFLYLLKFIKHVRSGALQVLSFFRHPCSFILRSTINHIVSPRQELKIEVKYCE